ncbi:MAG: hypothetical protein Unbinned7358contig1001_42 [Prokaryotic dsDNA virus sp.]|nr:MAG: hypothetical protein Unbinned7358contig1001_42 [Prokaryotic dsDNA virus sp.]|tara:strand:- start:2240 stop:3013 length:774 start_codon:yes stop_codon:yes gene_type:complete
MCDPVTIGIAGLAMGGMQMVQGSQAARAQARAQSMNQRRAYDYEQQRYLTESEYHAKQREHQDETYIENARRATDAALRNYDMIQERVEQDRVVSIMEINKIARDSRSLQSAFIGNAADREVAGASVDYLLDAIAFNELEATNNIVRERQWKFDEAIAAGEDVEAQTQARIDSANPTPLPLPALPAPIGVTTRPSSFSALMSGASTMLNAAQFYFQNTPATPRTMPTPPAPQMPGIQSYGGQTQMWGWHSPKPSWVD